MAKLIPIRFAIVDDDDYETLCQYDWSVTEKGYVFRSDNGQHVLMHHVIMSVPEGKFIDRKNGIGIDNRKINLRECTLSQNNMNRRVLVSITKTSQYKGVSIHHEKWRARIQFDGKDYKLGSYSDQAFAAKVYDAAARYHFGEFANTNFPGKIALSIQDILMSKKEGKLEMLIG